MGKHQGLMDVGNNWVTILTRIIGFIASMVQ